MFCNHTRGVKGKVLGQEYVQGAKEEDMGLFFTHNELTGGMLEGRLNTIIKLENLLRGFFK